MESIVAVTGIIAALAIGTVSPGPSFVQVARTAIAQSRRDGLAAALGMGVGGVVFGSLALLGLQAVLAQVGWLYASLKVLGGVYLLYLAAALWRGAKAPLALHPPRDAASAGLGRSFWQALATQLSNPKTAIVYASIFAALLPAQHPRWTAAVLLPSILVLETGWYGVVAVAFSAERPRAVYLRSKAWIDRLAASIMGLLGLRLIAAASGPG